MTTIAKGLFHAKAALVKGENPLPIFRSVEHDIPVRVKPGFPPEYQQMMGLDCGRRVLPYRLQDRYDRNREEIDLPSIIMENRYLKATFLPTLGGRLISLLDKTERRELLHCNTSVQVGNLSNLDAWFAGGIEWNIGQYGHAFTTCSRLFATLQNDIEGQPFLRFYEFERCKNLWWHIDFHLPGDSSLLYAHVQVHNLGEESTSLYFWANAAVPVDDEVRVLSSSKEAIYLDPYASKGERLFGFMHMPDMLIYPGLDVSYPARFTASNEYFFTCEESPMPWECALSKDGAGFFEASTHPLSFRKMFCWGSHDGGKRWQRHLAPDTNDEYIELQSGLAASQLHGQLLAAGGCVCWTQAFGLVHANPREIHSTQYGQAMQAAADAIASRLQNAQLTSMHRIFQEASDIAPKTFLEHGSGWGYLESLLCNMELPKAFAFGLDGLGRDEHAYLQFLQDGVLPVMDPESVPLPPPPCSTTWKQLFFKALGNPRLESGQRATLLHYLGIMHLECEEVSLAQTCWLQAMVMLPNAWTARNLAQLEKRRGQFDEALRWYACAFASPGFFVDYAIAEEYCTLLMNQQQKEEARRVFEQLPAAWLQSSETLVLLRAKLAAIEGKPLLVKELVFEREFGHIREGDTILSELWLEYSMRTYQAEHPEMDARTVLAYVKTHAPIPKEYDMTMFKSNFEESR